MSDINFSYTIAMVTKMATKKLKIEKEPFWYKFETFYGDINKEQIHIRLLLGPHYLTVLVLVNYVSKYLQQTTSADVIFQHFKG